MQEDSKRPNIVFLFPDQFRADFTGFNGADWLNTPNIDSIAENGVSYSNSFSASPICVPARTALLTGMNAIRNGVTTNLHNLRADWRDAGLRTWPEILSENGYYTAGIGKMHFYPWDEKRGFQYRVVCEDKRWLDVRDDYYHYLKDKGLNKALIERCKESNFEAMAVTVDTAVGGNRERDLYTGFTIPMKLKLNSVLSFMLHPKWAVDYFTKPKWELSNLKDHINEGTTVMTTIGDYFTKMLDNSMSWKDVENINKEWGRQFAIKGVMSVDDAKKAVDVGASAIMVSNHGGRQLDGSRSPFDQLAEIVDAVGDKIDVICEGGIRRGTHVLKALSLGAKACSGGRMYLYALAAGGQKGVELALSNLKKEIERDMILMGVSNINELSKKNLRFR